MGLSKIINKVNKAKSAINSLKGIGSKLSSLQYNSVTDQLGAEAQAARKHLTTTRNANERGGDWQAKVKGAAKTVPTQDSPALMYPLGDILANYIVFTILPRKSRKGTKTETHEAELGGDNVLSAGSTIPEIMLYIPDGITSESSVTYANQDFGLATRKLDKFIQTAKKDGALEAFSSGKSAIGEVASSQFQKFVNSMSGGTVNVREGRAINPMHEALFEGVAFRTWEFEYEFWPKNEFEAGQINRIIYTFRTAMLPDTYGQSLTDGVVQNSDENYFNYPNIFKVEYDGPIAKTLDKFLPMVLTSCKVDHFNGGRAVTFEGGQPISTKMNLTFQEIKILSQESYQEISPIGSTEQGHIKSMDSIREGRKTADPAKPKDGDNG